MLIAGGKLTSKAQTTMPKKIREFLNLKPGDSFYFVERDGEIVLRPRNVTVDELCDILGPPPNGKSYPGDALLNAIDEAVEQEAAARASAKDKVGQ